MGRKVKWFDTVQKILYSSEPDPVDAEAKKAAKSRDKPSFKKLWQFTKSSNNNNASTSAVPDAHRRQPRPPPSPPPQPDQQQGQEIVVEARSTEVRCEQGKDRVRPAEEEVAAQAAASAEEGADPTDATPRTLPARSDEDIAATRIQAASRGYLARRANRERGMARLMSLVEGLAVKRQTEDALYGMQTMTRVQTQIYSRRLKTEEDKKALKSQIKIKQSFDKTKIGEEGWDHSYQSKEQMASMMAMKQEAASRRQRALTYAFFNQWSNRNPSSVRAAPPPMFMDPGNPNWGWTWTERWMAATRPWEERQSTELGTGRATAKSAGGRPRVTAISIEPPPPTTPGGRSFRPPSWPSLPSPSTPLPRSPSVSFGRAAVPTSPRSSTLHAASGLQHTKSLQPERCPREGQERAAAVSSPRGVVPASPRRSSSPLRAASSLQRTTSMQPERRPRSSQERAASSPRHAGTTTATLLRTSSLRSEPLRRLSLKSGAPENAGAPVTPSYMQPTTSVRAKAWCKSPSLSSSPNKPDAPEASSPPSARKRLSLVVADRASTSSPSTAKVAGRAKRHSQPPSPRMQLP